MMLVGTYIGSYCYIGTRTIILPFFKIVYEVIVSADAVVTIDVPSNCIVSDNPA